MLSMDANDRKEIRELMTDILAAHTEKVDGQYNLIAQKLESIEAQTTRTNGRVLKLENETVPNINEKITKLNNSEMTHVLSCPITSRVLELEKDQIERKSIKKFLIAAITLLGILIGCVAAAYKIITGVG